MPEVIFEETDGTEHRVAVPVGESLMQAAVNELVPGLEGDCGGLCACGTCHVYVPQEWSEQFAVMDELESSILAFAYEVDGRSRLSCQLTMTEALDGVRILLPSRQY